VRLGGIVAVKEQDGISMTHAPADPTLLWRLYMAWRPTDGQIDGILRARQLRRWLERAGLEEVEQRTVMIERWAPLRPVEREFMASSYAAGAAVAPTLDLPEADQAFWRAQRDPASAGANQARFATAESESVRRAKKRGPKAALRDPVPVPLACAAAAGWGDNSHVALARSFASRYVYSMTTRWRRAWLIFSPPPSRTTTESSIRMPNRPGM
jgi:hypothetical protein